MEKASSLADVDFPTELLSTVNLSVYGMDRASRSELLKSNESLKDQLQQYKTKLRDVVSAYKSLAKEKEALEASLSALTLSPNSERSDTSLNRSDGVQNEENDHHENETTDPVDPLGVTQPPTANTSSNQATALKEQLKVLTAALTTLTQEKNKIENQFLADKRQLRQENEEFQRRIQEEQEENLAKKNEFEQQIQELKSRIRNQQLDREKEQTDHVLMLRELQKLLAEERMQKEYYELQLDEARRTLQDNESHNNISEQYEKKIRELSEELKSMFERMQKAEVQASQPSPFVLKLQKEILDIKAQNQQAVVQEQVKAAEAETRLLQQSKLSEERISSLEEKLSELSGVVGDYERLRFQDQQVIQKLKERVTQLDIENTALVRATKVFGGADNMEEENLDAQALYERLLQLRDMLYKANKRSEKPVDISGLFQDNKLADKNCAVCKQHKEELDQVKEEFERYKLRAQSVLKNKHKDNSSTKEVDVLKDQVSDLRERLKTTTIQHQEEVEQMHLKVDGLSRSMLAQADSHKIELAQLKSAHQKEIFVLELEAKKQRERTIALLAEKDQEIEQLKTATSSRFDSEIYSHMRDFSLESLRDTDGLLQGESESEEAVAKLLMHPAAQGEATLLHFAQEKARQDVEINNLRRQKHQLENALREMQHTVSLKEERSQETIQHLEEQIHKLERDKSRESANLEYLKNVFLKFLTSNDSHGRKQMLKAIATILQFSPSEKDALKANVHL